ncbi:MAG: hypothetical protein HGB02_08720 [Chlorobiaceae bacterium]|nr:hypothetical protein [Chlorobiaceae bacterium]
MKTEKREIPVFITSDGEEFFVKSEAQGHEIDIAIKNFCDGTCWSGMTASDVQFVLKDNFDELKDMVKLIGKINAS